MVTFHRGGKITHALLVIEKVNTSFHYFLLQEYSVDFDFNHLSTLWPWKLLVAIIKLSFGNADLYSHKQPSHTNQTSLPPYLCPINHQTYLHTVFRVAPWSNAKRDSHNHPSYLPTYFCPINHQRTTYSCQGGSVIQWKVRFSIWWRFQALGLCPESSTFTLELAYL